MIFNVANMSFNAIPEIKFLQKFPNLQFLLLWQFTFLYTNGKRNLLVHFFLCFSLSTRYQNLWHFIAKQS